MRERRMRSRFCDCEEVDVGDMIALSVAAYHTVTLNASTRGGLCDSQLAVALVSAAMLVGASVGRDREHVLAVLTDAVDAAMDEYDRNMSWDPDSPTPTHGGSDVVN